MNTILKGDICTARVIAELVSINVPVSIPFSTGSSYDLVIEVQNKLYKVQCKKSRSNSTGFVIANKRTFNNGMRGATQAFYTPDEVDLFATWFEGKAYLIPFEYTNKNHTTFVLEYKMNIGCEIRLAEYFEAKIMINNNLIIPDKAIVVPGRHS